MIFVGADCLTRLNGWVPAFLKAEELEKNMVH